MTMVYLALFLSLALGIEASRGQDQNQVLQLQSSVAYRTIHEYDAGTHIGVGVDDLSVQHTGSTSTSAQGKDDESSATHVSTLGCRESLEENDRKHLAKASLLHEEIVSLKKANLQLDTNNLQLEKENADLRIQYEEFKKALDSGVQTSLAQGNEFGKVVVQGTQRNLSHEEISGTISDSGDATGVQHNGQNTSTLSTGEPHCSKDNGKFGPCMTMTWQTWKTLVEKVPQDYGIWGQHVCCRNNRGQADGPFKADAQSITKTLNFNLMFKTATNTYQMKTSAGLAGGWKCDISGNQKSSEYECEAGFLAAVEFFFRSCGEEMGISTEHATAAVKKVNSGSMPTYTSDYPKIFLRIFKQETGDCTVAKNPGSAATKQALLD